MGYTLTATIPEHPRVLGIIPARGGSRGIPRKNIVPLAGKPLLAYSIEAANASKSLTRTILTTDDAEIAEVGRQLGADVPFLRPSELAGDRAATLPVVQHAIEQLAAAGQTYHAYMLLQPTSPLRRSHDIDLAVDLLVAKQADSVVSFVDVGEYHPCHMVTMGADGWAEPIPVFEEFRGKRRQELPEVYVRDGSIYLVTAHWLQMHGQLYGGRMYPMPIPARRYCNINEPHDILQAEFLLHHLSD